MRGFCFVSKKSVDVNGEAGGTGGAGDGKMPGRFFKAELGGANGATRKDVRFVGKKLAPKAARYAHGRKGDPAKKLVFPCARGGVSRKNAEKQKSDNEKTDKDECEAFKDRAERREGKKKDQKKSKQGVCL